jgi:hypothetical protein
MSHPDLVPSNEHIVETMIELTRLSKSHRVIVAGSNAFDIYLGLLRRGFGRAGRQGLVAFPANSTTSLSSWESTRSGPSRRSWSVSCLS